VDFKARTRTSSISIRKGRAPVVALAPAMPHPRHARRASAQLPSLDQITARLARSGNSCPSNGLAPPSPVTPNGAGLGIGRPPLRLAMHRRSPSSPLATLPMAPSQVGAEVDVKGVEASTPVTTPAVKAQTSRLPAFLQKRGTRSPPPAIIISSPTSPQDKSEFEAVPLPVTEISSILNNCRRHHPIASPTPLLHPIPRPPVRLQPSARPTTPETRKQKGLDMVEKLRRRSSAPAELPAISRRDAHPVLSMKGGF